MRTRKVLEALAFWRQFPRRIASDLQRFFRRHISEWHSGAMSSYELMELFGVTVTDDPEAETRHISVDFAPEDGAVADALRDGERPEWKQMLAQSANIAALFRSAKFPKADTDSYGERLFPTVGEVRRRVDERRAIEEYGGLILLPGEG